MSDTFDIVIAGAGMVGACTALALSRQGHRIALIEAAEISHHLISSNTAYDLRVSAITPTSQQLLSQYGLWQTLDADRICPYEKMTVWHESGNAKIIFDSVELAQQSLGTIVENQQIITALHHACDAEQNLEWFCPDHIKTVHENSECRINLRLKSNIVLSANLLIVADGRNSPTRELVGLKTVQGNYRQTAIIANITTEYPHQSTAWQRFLSTGTLAFLPLANGQCSIVWSCDQDLAEHIIAMDEIEFCRAISQAFEYQLGEVQTVSQRQQFPLHWHRCEQWLKQRVLLIGDAAHSVHPLAGQGVNLGFSDVARLIELISAENTVWNPTLLRRFERQRKSQTTLAMQVFSSLNSIYSVDNWPVSQLRDLGMRLVQSNPVVKRSLMKQALRNMA